MRLFLSRKREERLVEEKAAQLASRLYQAMYGLQLSPGFNIELDESQDDYVKLGYEGNPDVFSISSKLARMFSRVDIKCFKAGSETEVDDPLEELFYDPITDYTLTEFKQHWELFGLITGNAIFYAPQLTGGNNKGKLLHVPQIVPTQLTEIQSKGWMQPIGNYLIKLNDGIELNPIDICHTRFFPNLDFMGGKNFMGISPVSVALDVIKSQNSGYKRMNALLTKGGPPFMIAEDNGTGFDMKRSMQQASELDKYYKRKYNDPDKASTPLFTMGKYQVFELGIKSMKDLEVLASSRHGLRVLCNIWGVPSQAFNDSEQSTYSNMMEARKSVYEDRLMPDVELWCNTFNKLMRDGYGVEYRPDYSDVPCLQPDLKAKAELFRIQQQMGKRVILDEEIRAGMGRDPLTPEQIAAIESNEEAERAARNIIY